MSHPATPQPNPDEPLQFEEAEFAGDAAAGMTCVACKSPILDHYYETSGRVVCERCRAQVEQAYSGGSKLGRFLKASALGMLAAVVGVIGYYAVSRATGYNIGLVAVVVGLMVGGAVKRGSGGRGGLFYQFLALFLTYTSIVLMLIPLLLDSLSTIEDEKEQQAQVAAPKDAPREAEAEDAKADDPASAPEQKAEAAEGKTDVADVAVEKKEAGTDSPTPAAPEPPKAAAVEGEDEGDPMIAVVEEKPTTSQFAMFFVILIGFAYSLPVQMAMVAPISGLIYGFALWEAWKINRREAIVFNGPYQAATPEIVEDDHDEAPSHGS